MVKPLLTAVALVLILEGITPFASPRAMRRTLFKIVQQNDKTLRIAGLSAMIGGVVVLYLVRNGLSG